MEYELTPEYDSRKSFYGKATVSIVDFDTAYNSDGTPSDENAPAVWWDSERRRAYTETGWKVWRSYEPYEVVKDNDLRKFGREHGTVWAIVSIEYDVLPNPDTVLGWAIVVKDGEVDE